MPTPGRSSHGWELYFGPLFSERWAEIRTEARHLKDTLPKREYQSHPTAKLFAALVQIVHETVPADPNHDDFQLGHTMGKENISWRRVKKKGLPDRMRLFFKFAEKEKIIIFSWLNDENTLRKAGSLTDVYQVFKKMLANGNPPSDFEELLKEADRGK